MRREEGFHDSLFHEFRWFLSRNSADKESGGRMSAKNRVGTVNWQFRAADERIKLKRLYPVRQPNGL